MVRGVWFQSDGRGVWPSVEPERPPPKRRDPRGRGVLDFRVKIKKQLYLTFVSSLCLRFPPVNRGDPQNRGVCLPEPGPKKTRGRHVQQKEGSNVSANVINDI